MRTFLISYDLAKPDNNKAALCSAIMMLGHSWARPLDQTWYLKTDMKDSDIENVLNNFIGEDDGLLVQCVEHGAMLANTQLRWFKQRAQPLSGVETNIIAFPVPPELPPAQDELAIAS